MTIRIRQKSKYQGDDWWRWSIWVEGTPAELDGIEKVIYTLHPTFANPVRTVEDRASKFGLHSSGWGGFGVFAQVFNKDGSSQKLQHFLKLFYPNNKLSEK
ncbi:pYEATS domain-containing protein [Mesorhizobium sp. B4-1-4]|uniref:pYEATS domain-containing protein n=1 Tax=Mesorhizobium sp. B4-1-4 TaxID=2589888 RepID=UPI0011292148|nr:pYEATS domain-containing protein [Mesorhizobium sp. B4-1-4]UCI32131.1 hypothetical protein FJW03_01320 [Mesorhizobium sp. B4-1-4]